MRLGIKGKQVLGVALIVGLAVVAVSALSLASLTRVSLQESRERGRLIVNAIYHRAFKVVEGRDDPGAALREDPGLRSILESSLYPAGVTYAAIVGVDGNVVADSDPTREGTKLTSAGDMDDLLARNGFSQLRTIYSPEGQTLEVREPLRFGGAEFGSIRVGVSTVLMRKGIQDALVPALGAAGGALLVAIAVAMFFANLILRPIHVLRSGLTRMARGEFGVKLDLPQQDEFGELGTFFNTVSAQLSADRTHLTGQVAKLESAVEHLEDAVALFNPEGELLFANPAMRATLPADPLARAVDDLLPAGHPYRGVVEQTLATRQSCGPTSASVALPDGREAEQASHAGGERLIMTHAIKDVDDRLLGVMLVARNLEYLGRVQSTINYSRKLAALGRLSAGVAHEVKNPLNAMMIHLALLKQKLLAGSEEVEAPQPADDGPLAARTALGGSVPRPDGSEPPAAGRRVATSGLDVTGAIAHTAIIAGEIRRLDEVVQGFLKFTRPEDLRLQPLDVAALVDDVVRVVEPEAHKAGVTLVNDCGPDDPDINGDPAMLRQAVLNLALNACQAMPHGGVLRFACAAAHGRRVALTVEDSGVGIKPQDLDKIFDLYFTTKERGSGIGLSMVYRIVQIHDGEIEVHSTPGRGTTFRLLLPQA
jgi:signal transduction histidine kinase/HAMP domain-containing protein